MHRTPRLSILLAFSIASSAACGSTSGGAAPVDASAVADADPTAPDANPAAPDAAVSACALADNTTATAVASTSGCHVLVRDTSGCQAARAAAGLAGYWLKFSCRVTLTKTTSGATAVVRAASDGRPDYLSNYFATTDACWEAYTSAIQNPNTIATKAYQMDLPTTPAGSSHPMAGGIVGIALNGVPIFGDFAAPGDDIFQEVMTFDRCGAHPQMSGAYHYHGEPYAISNDDDAFIGVMRDGYPIYGRRDPDHTIPTVDTYGGHTGVTVDSPTTPVYHYHLNLQTSTSTATSGQQQWFLTTGTYRSAPSTCTGC
jgi:hypothetical protein